MKSEMDNYVDGLKEAKVKETTNELNAVMGSFAKADDLSTMPEGVYNNVFKPYFTGEKPLEEGNDIISKWVEYAGNVRRGIHLVDDNGSIVETIPGIVRSTPADFVVNVNVDFKKLGIDYELLKTRSAEQAEHTLDNAVNQIKTATEVIKPNMDAFNKIMEDGDDFVPSEDDDFIVYD